MNATSSRPFSPVPQKNFKQHLSNWRLYALAGGALASADTRATADIVYQSINQTLNPGQNGHINLKSTGGADRPLGFGISIIYNPSFQFSEFSNIPAQGAASLAGDTAFGGHGSLKFYAANVSNSLAKTFASGSGIGGSHQRRSAGLGRKTNQSFSIGSGTRFVGFKTNGGGKGWIRLNLSNSGGFPSLLQIIDLAYDTAGGIAAGQMTAPAAVPEPGSMAMAILAAGATGLMALRRAKAQVAAA